jgi:regulator of RNase E activity RraA
MSIPWKDERLGYKVVKRPSNPALDLSRFDDLSTANVSDLQGKLLTFDYRIKPVLPLKSHTIGFAITVLVRPGDNLIIFKAMEIAQPGDVIVIADQFDTNNSVLGGVMAEMAKQKGIAAFVTDGLVRDLEELENVGVPVFARGLTPVAPAQATPMGQVNTPISCGGVIVHPGDIVKGDKDGVVIIPTADAETVLERSKDLKQKEYDWLNPSVPGQFALYEISHGKLKGLNCEFDPNL